ncbi:MAG: hypothetical protein Kow00127_19310 [Bacteroidales bacterium]
MDSSLQLKYFFSPDSMKWMLVIFLGWFLLAGSVTAQQLSTRSKKARKAYFAGEQAFRAGKNGEAEYWFREAIGHDSTFFEAWVVLAEVAEEQKNEALAVEAYRHVINLNPDGYPPAFYYLANLEYSNGDYSPALEHYKAFLGYETKNRKHRQIAVKHIKNCEFAIEAIAHPVDFKPVNLGEGVNTPLNEYFPCLTADGSMLLFTRLVPSQASYTGRQEDFFVSWFTDGEWSPAEDIGPPINTRYNEGAPTLSVDGNVLIFTACEQVDGYGAGRTGYGRCDLFISGKREAGWSEPVNLGPPVSTRFWESQPCLSADGRTLYFISNRESDYDIWYSVQDDLGEWSTPELIPGEVNTSGYEGSVFIHPDNQTLYFSSDGHTGMGGLDIFYSRRDSTGAWGTPVNLGYPINTWGDENSILIAPDGKLALFASDRDEGYGGLDLYAFELYEEARPAFVTYVKGKVFDIETRKPLKARFELTDLETGRQAVRAFSNKETGEFLVCLPTGKSYALNAWCDGYLFFSEHYSLETASGAHEPFHIDVPMRPVKSGQRMVLNNVFFDTDDWTLKPESRTELDKLVLLMTKNPSVKIEISGHTDDVGTGEYNQKLSENRAKAVYDYLTRHGIDPGRLSYKGFGETMPVESNETDAGRAQNRRTEIRIL